MTGNEVDLFSQRLAQEMGSLSWQERNDLILKIGKMEMRMRMNGQERPLWRGPGEVQNLLGADVVVQTEHGERRGRVVCFGLTQMPDGVEYERSVIVHVPASGTHHEAPGSMTRVASEEDSERIQGELEMAKRLSEVTAPTGPSSLSVQIKPRKRGEKDPKLVERMIQAAKDSPNVRSVDETATNFKVTGVDPNKRLYVFKNQLRVDISGVSVEHPGIRLISEEEAKDMHLGKVRGQMIFDKKEVSFEGFQRALEMLK